MLIELTADNFSSSVLCDDSPFIKPMMGYRREKKIVP